jgi:hypothetical protein
VKEEEEKRSNEIATTGQMFLQTLHLQLIDLHSAGGIRRSKSETEPTVVGRHSLLEDARVSTGQHLTTTLV